MPPGIDVLEPEGGFFTMLEMSRERATPTKYAAIYCHEPGVARSTRERVRQGGEGTLASPSRAEETLMHAGLNASRRV